MVSRGKSAHLMATVTSLALATIIIMAAAIPAAAAPLRLQAGGNPELGGDQLVSSTLGGQAMSASAYNDAADEYLVVWSEGRNDTHATDIYGQIYNAQGVPLGENFVIAIADGHQSAPAVAYNSTQDEYLVVWHDFRNISRDIYGQRVDADGTLLGGNLAIETDGDNQRNPAVAYNSAADEYLVVWEDERDAANNGFDIYGRRVDADGFLLGSDLAIGTWTHDEYKPDLAYNATDDEYLVVWERMGSASGPLDVYGQLLEASGGLIGNVMAIASGAEDQKAPALVWNSQRNEYFTVWEDYEHQATTGADIRGQRRHADGNLDQGHIYISDAYGDQIEPDVAFDPTIQQYLVVWRDKRDELTSGDDIYGQRVLAHQQHASPAEQGNFVICQVAYDQMNPAVAYSGTSHQFLVTWDDFRNGHASHLYGQRVWWPGLLLGQNFSLATPNDDQEAPAVAYNSRDHEYLVVWEDYRAGDGDIYAQRYDRDGLPLQNSFAIVAWGGDQVHPDLAYNSADNEYLLVWEDTIGPNVLGQRLSAQGDPIGSTIHLFHVTGPRRQPVVTYNEVDNEYLVAYVYVSTSKDVYGSLVSAAGVLLRSDLYICLDDGDQDQIDVTHDPIHDQYFVVWRSLQNDWGDIYARRVEADGQMLSTKVVVSVAADAQAAPAVAWNGDDGEYLVTWHDYRNSGTTGSDIYAQRFRGSGGSEQGNFMVSTSAGLDFQQYPDVVYVGDLNRYRIVWQDNREAGTLGWDIRGQWVAADGTVLGASDGPVLRYYGDQEEPALAYGSAYHQAFAVWQDGRDGVATDVHGRLGALDLTPPQAHFTRDPAFGQAGDVFAFNAGPSSDNATPPGLLMARWDLDSNGTWDVDWSLNKYISLTIGAPNLYTVTLEVRDLAWLTDSVSYPVLVLPATQVQAPLAVPPTATLAISPTYALAGTSFSFDGSGSAGQGTLLARWDWENDGAFDTGFGPVLSATHTYLAAGTHTARLEIRDDSGLSDAALYNVTVLPAAPVSLEVMPGEASLIAGRILPFRATARDAYDNLMYHPSVAWSMADATAGQIGTTGVFTAGLQAGTYPAAVLGDAGGVQDSASITIFYPYHTYLPILMRSYP